jgi:hypothetical protein
MVADLAKLSEFVLRKLRWVFLGNKTVGHLCANTKEGWNCRPATFLVLSVNIQLVYGGVIN